MNILIKHQGHITTVTLNRPEKLNALSKELLAAIWSAFEEICHRKETRCVILTGAGKAFAAGADLEELAASDCDAAIEVSLLGKKAFNAIEQFRCPVIAVVNGFALGGGSELALACDFILASEKAKFGLPEVGLGVIPGFGGMQRLATRVGTARAKELIFTGKMIDAEEADRIGLVNRVLPSEELMTACFETAEQIAAVGPGAVAVAKQSLVDYSGGLAESSDLEDSKNFGGLFGLAEQTEGMQAFIEKRKPDF
jgi:enoyl-CoA hydratase